MDQVRLAVFKINIMKKSLIYFASILAIVVFFFNCDQDTLDRTARPESEISFIKVELQDEQVTSPNDDSGLDPVYATFVNKTVTLSSTTTDSEVQNRIWFIPQPTGPGDASLNIQEVENMDSIILDFKRANNTSSDTESQGFPIVLVETLLNGTVNRFATQIQVRNVITADFSTAGVATVNAPTAVRALSAADLGLSTTDLFGEGQVVFEWDFGNGVIQTANGPVSTFITNNVNASFNIVFDTITPDGQEGELVTLTVTRNYPLRSTDTVEKRIIVVAGLTPDRGDGKDPIKLSAVGNIIEIGYQGVLANVSAISSSDYELSIVSDEITDINAKATVDNISVTSVDIDPNNPNNLLLTLSSFVPSIVMDNVALTYTSEALVTDTGLLVDVFNDSKVFPTGDNLLVGINASGFEDQTQWKDGGFFNPNPPTAEMDYSTEQSLDGNSSFMYNTTSTLLSTFPNNFGIGLSIVEGDPITLPVSVTAQYVISFWVYVENSQAGTNLMCFLLDFADFTTAVDPSTLPTGEWVRVYSTRNIGPTTDSRPLIRIVNGSTTSTSKLFIDQVEMRIVDDGR